MEDPRCPECGEPIGATATYCMHCSSDLTGRGAVDLTGRGAVDAGISSTETGSGPTQSGTGGTGGGTGGDMLDPDGLLDDSLTVVVGIVGGFVIGVVVTFALLIITASAIGLVGVVVWLGSTAYLVRRRTVQDAISRAAYGVTLALAVVPLIPFSPMVEADAGGRVVLFVVLVFLVGIPAVILAGIGYAVSKYVPDGTDAEDGRGDAAR